VLRRQQPFDRTVRSADGHEVVAKLRCRNHRAAQEAFERLAMTIESTGLPAVIAVQ
jgi:hypothetical protein